jgi:hypothetical protein
MSPWGDALFELVDAALCAPGPLRSVPALSLEPTFRRSHGSLYKALALGEVDHESLRRLLVEHRPDNWPAVFAVDSSAWDRCDAECSPERGFYYSASKHSAGQPIVAGWNYQWICQLEVPMFVLDAGYDPIALSSALAVRAQILCRIKSDRVFYTDPSPRRAGQKGRPRRHGRRFKCSDPKTAPKADAELKVHDLRYGAVRVRAWHQLHPKLHGRGRWAGSGLPIVRGSVIRVDVARLPKPFPGARKTLWLWWSGPCEPDLELCFRAYLRRFDIEHTFRFAKNTLGWTTPSLCTPGQADRWSWLVVAAYTQLRLARGLVEDVRLPWERRLDPALLTPARVRRGFRRLRAMLGTPASPPKSDVAGPGRPKGTATGPRKRYPAIKKTA